MDFEIGNGPKLAPELIDADADRVVRKLVKAGYKAYLVGGCVRDLLVGKTPKDFDVATSATPNEVRNTFRNCRIIGRRFRLAHVYFGDKIIETSTFRAKPKEGEDDGELLIRRDNVFGSETEDAQRRDFTINGLFYDVEAERVKDHVGGLADLRAGVVRTIGDPDIRFQEDPVRMLRAIKFAARLNFAIEPRTFEALLRWRGEVFKCAPPRLLEELYRLLRGGAARRSFELLVQTDLLRVLSPHLAALLSGPGAPVSAMDITVAPMAANTPRIRRSESEFGEPDLVVDADRDDDRHLAANAMAQNALTDLFPNDHFDGDLEQSLDTHGGFGSAEPELDDEERAWHAVWAEPPRSLSYRATTPSPFAQTHLPPLPKFDIAPAVLAAQCKVAWQMMRVLDGQIAAGSAIDNAMALAAMLAPFLSAAEPPTESSGSMAAIVHPVLVELPVTRRESERLRFLLLAQRKFAIANSKRTAPRVFGAPDLVADAAQLFVLTAQAQGTELAEAVRAFVAGQVPAHHESHDATSEEFFDGDPTRKRRRRRRGGRFR